MLAAISYSVETLLAFVTFCGDKKVDLTGAKDWQAEQAHWQPCDRELGHGIWAVPFGSKNLCGHL
jgi:hypothetical protein